MNRAERRWHERQARLQAKQAGVPASEIARVEVDSYPDDESALAAVRDIVAREKPKYGSILD